MPSQFEPYLDQVEAPARSLSEAERALWRAEAEGHLQTLYDEARARGLSHADALRAATGRFGAPRVLGAALEMESRQSVQRRLGREIALRVAGALAVPAFAALLLACFAPQDNGTPAFQLGSGIGFQPLSDWTLAIPFLAGLAGAGYQAVARRRLVAVLLAGGLGSIAAVPAILIMARLIDAVRGVLPAWKMGDGSLIGSAYGWHMLNLLPSAGLLFAAWCAALGTRPQRAASGSALFALAAYLLYQLRDCFLEPGLLLQLGPMLLMACLVFVLPAAFLGGLYGGLGQLARTLARRLLVPRRARGKFKGLA